MAKKDQGAQLQAVDRWASRRRRSFQFLRQNGVGGLIAKVREAGIGGTTGFVKRQLPSHVCSFLGAPWDRRFGVDKSGQIDLIDIDVVGANKDGGLSSVSHFSSSYLFP